MTGPVASQLLKMLRSKVPAGKILRLAIHEYEGMEAALKFVATAKLGASARALRMRIQAALKARQPRGPTGICLAVNTGSFPSGSSHWLRFEGYPDLDRGEAWETVDLSRCVSPLWSPPVFKGLAHDLWQGEELALLMTAVLARDAFARGHPGLESPLAIFVRPECDGETLLVGRVHARRIELECSGHGLWFSGD